MSKNTAAPRAEPPRARRPAASGKTSQGRKLRSIRPSTRSPTSSRPRRASPGENFAARQTAHQLSHRIRAGLVRGELRASADGPCTNRPHRTRAGPFQGKFHRHVRLPARQLSSTASAQGCSGKNFTSPKITAQQTAPRPHPVRRRNARRPVQPFWSNFAARKDSPPVSSTPPHPRRAAPGKTSQAKNHSAADGATLAARPTILVKLRGPLDGATIIHPPVRPGQTSYARKRPPDARPSK